MTGELEAGALLLEDGQAEHGIPLLLAGGGLEQAVAAIAASGALLDSLHYIRGFLADTTVQPVAAEDSDGHEGYSQPHRITPRGDGVQLMVRLRDFTDEGLAARKAVVQGRAPKTAAVKVFDQYRNMAPRLAHRPELLDYALEAGESLLARVQSMGRTVDIAGA